MTMREIAIWLGSMQIELFESNQVLYMDAYCNGAGIRDIMNGYYNRLVADKKIIAIENLDPEYKKELKSTAIEIADGRLNVDGMVQLCKCLQVLAYHKTI